MAKKVKNRAYGFFLFFFVKTLQSDNNNGLKKCEICGKYGDIIKRVQLMYALRAHINHSFLETFYEELKSCQKSC